MIHSHILLSLDADVSSNSESWYSTPTNCRSELDAHCRSLTGLVTEKGWFFVNNWQSTVDIKICWWFQPL